MMRSSGPLYLETRAFRVLLLAAFVAFAGGCRPSRPSECNLLLESVYRGTPRLARIRRAVAPPRRGDLQALSEELDELVEDMASAPLRIPELQAFSTDYQKLLKGVARATRALAAAPPEPSDAAATAKPALEAELAREKEVTTPILKTCRAL